MSILDDAAIFATVVQRGGFSHAAKQLGLSNGLISRRIAQLEAKLGVTLIKRTTRQLHLTAEGELFWQHAQRIQQELDSALSVIQSLSEKPKGEIRMSAPLYFGRHCLLPIITSFMNNFSDIKIDLILTNERLDPIKEKLDLTLRATGYSDQGLLKDSSLKNKLFIKQHMGLYASPEYLIKNGYPQIPEDLNKHSILGFASEQEWIYQTKDKQNSVMVQPDFNCNDTESRVIVCSLGYGIGKFPLLAVSHALQQQKLQPVLPQYNWGEFNLYAIYPNQQALPKRTRVLLEFISANINSQNCSEKISRK